MILGAVSWAFATPAHSSQAVLTARVASDEKSVRITATGADISDASRICFKIWPQSGDPSAAIELEAARMMDGAWSATAFVAAAQPSGSEVPYNCAVPQAVHRLYNPYTYEHFFTRDVDEAGNLSRIGWRYEGVAWVEPQKDDGAAKAVYRLFNPYTDDHHYTSDANEYRSLPEYGWQQEGLAFYSDPTMAQPIYRLYNPYLTSAYHHFTSDANEHQALVESGWVSEGVDFYGAAVNGDGSWSVRGGNRWLNEAGDYVVEASILSFDGSSTGAPLASASFVVSAPTARIHSESIDNGAGTFDVVIDEIDSKSGIARVEAPTWDREGNQGDIRWYEPQRQADGSYRLTVSAADHDLAKHYLIHCYLTAGNGLRVLAAQATVDLTLDNYVTITGGPYEFTASICKEGSVDAVRVPVWSDENGQDDIRWYEATPQGDGWWTASLSTETLMSAGLIHVHFYADELCCATRQFSIEPWQLPYRGFQNPPGYFQVSHRSVDFPHQGEGNFGYRTESRISPWATKEECVETMIGRAVEYLGTPYKWGYSAAPGVGVDCSGLVIQALYATGMDLDPLNPWVHYYDEDLVTTTAMIESGGFKEVSFSERTRGDLIFYHDHVGIYLGDDQIIEATPPRVRISSVYRNPIVCVRRAFI